MEPENQTPKPRRSLFGCLFSGSMGCGAFLFGAALAAALFAPTMLGDVVGKWIETRFSRTHDGRLVIENLELSWMEEQSANGVKLLDADGETLVVFHARTPSLLAQLGLQDGPGSWEIDVRRARLEIDAEGQLNLDRALADRGRPFDWTRSLVRALGDRGHGSSGDGSHRLRVVGEDGVIVVADLRQTLEPVVVEDLEIEIDVEPGPGRSLLRRLRLLGEADFAGGGGCEVELQSGVLEGEWRGLLSGEEVPTRLVGSLGAGRGRLHELLGPQCEVELALRDSPSGRPGETRVVGRLEADRALVRWAFLSANGRVESLVGQPALQIVAPEGGHLSAEVVRWLFPWMHQGEPDGERGGVTVDVDRVSYDRAAGLSSLDARCTVALGAESYPPIRSVSDTLGVLGGHAFQLDSDAPIVLQVEGGSLGYDGLEMSIDAHRCSFRGHHHMEPGRVDVEIDVPLNFVGRRLLHQDALGLLMASDVTVPVQLAGPWRDPNLNVNLRVLQEAVSQNFKAAFETTAKDVLLKTIDAMVPADD